MINYDVLNIPRAFCCYTSYVIVPCLRSKESFILLKFLNWSKYMVKTGTIHLIGRAKTPLENSIQRLKVSSISPWSYQKPTLYNYRRYHFFLSTLSVVVRAVLVKYLLKIIHVSFQRQLSLQTSCNNKTYDAVKPCAASNSCCASTSFNNAFLLL